MKVDVIQAIMSDNDAVAAENRAALDALGVVGVNIMASPGAGKTSLILATAERLPAEVRMGVIEGDLASSIDAELIAAQGIAVVQINTGGGCHLDAPMIRSALPRLPLADLRLLMVENVGNLVCPANFLLGTHINVVVASAPEGHDKPFKYPGMFAVASVVLLNKADLCPIFEFDMERFSAGVRMVNPSAPIIAVSCRSGEGLDAWCGWLLAQGFR
jgi:hydrogenase nickel incorporation protein HypB